MVFVKVCAGIVFVPVVCMASVIPKGCVAVQLKVAPGVLLLSVTSADVPPEQIACVVGVKITIGDGFTVIFTVFEGPGHPLVVAFNHRIQVLMRKIVL